MARIIVKTNDGRHTVLDERDITLAKLDDQETAVELLERLSAALRDADRRLRTPRGPAVPKRFPTRKRGVSGHDSYLDVSPG